MTWPANQPARICRTKRVGPRPVAAGSLTGVRAPQKGLQKGFFGTPAHGCGMAGSGGSGAMEILVCFG
jgi:hypothetical protein